MRSASGVLALLLIGCAGAATPAPAEARRRPARPRAVVWDERPVDVLVAEAGRTGKRLVIDFWAEW